MPSGWKLLWQLGRADDSAAGFALDRDDFASFPHVFPGDPLYVVGRSRAKEDWPFIHPGPVDTWAGARPHTFTILFGLKTPLPTADCRLIIDLLDAHRTFPPRLELRVNDHLCVEQTKPGTSDIVEMRGTATAEQHIEVTIPARALRAGNNVVTITAVTGCWMLYGGVGFQAPTGTELQAVESTTSILSVGQTPVLLRCADGSECCGVRLLVRHTGDTTEATVQVDERPPSQVTLHAGTQNVDVPTPAVARPVSVAATLAIAGRPVAEQTIELRPLRKWIIYLLPHSHNDIGYTHVQTEVERKQWEYLETAIELARRTAENPPGARFRWNVEVMWAVDSYLRQAAPDKQQALIDAIRAGWIELDALYANELTGLCRPEELYRLVESGGQVARRCGVPLESAMITDIPGYTWGLVPVLAQAGVKYFAVGPNNGDRIGGTLAHWGDRPFYWVSPSGQERVLCWVAGRGYAMFHSARLERSNETRLIDYLAQLERADYPYDYVQLRYTIGGDNGPPDPNLCDFVKGWNARYVYPKLVIATTSEMGREFESRYGHDIPTARGDFTPYWEDGAASTARETAMNRESAERLVQAETLFALLDPDGYPLEAFDTAWRNVLLYDEHTWGAWNSVSDPDAPFVDQQWRIKQALALDGHAQARQLLTRAFAKRETPDGPVAALDVFNTCSWPRTNLVTLPADLSTMGDVVTTADGTPVPSQRLRSGELAFIARDVPPLAAKRFLIKPGAAPAEGQARAQPAALSTPLIGVQVDERTGAVVSLRGTAVRAELVDTHAAATVNDYRYMLGSDAAGAQPNGPVRITVQDAGPLVASLRIESAAPGCHHLVRDVRVVDGLPRVDLINTVDKQAVRDKEGVHFGFAFNVPDGTLRMEIPWAVVRPEVDQLPGACRNWFTVQRWVDVSNATYGLTWATLDAPLIEVGGLTGDRIGSQNNPKTWIEHLAPTQMFYSWVMNNHWHTNYKADQEGPTTFRYSIWPHAAFDAVAAQRFGMERNQPLIAVPAVASAPVPVPRLEVDPGSVIVTLLRPSRDGRALIVRLYNATDQPVAATLRWSAPSPRAVQRCNPFEEPGGPVNGPIELPAWGVVTLRAERA